MKCSIIITTYNSSDSIRLVLNNLLSIINDKDEFINRKYDYGLIISDFNRPIKNIDKSINILKNKKDKNIILIGKNSSKYANDGFVCKNLVDYNELNSKCPQNVEPGIDGMVITV